MWCVQRLRRHNWSGVHPFLLPNVPPFSRFQSKILDAGMVNGLICRVSLPGHFLNDTNLIYISHLMCALMWSVEILERHNLIDAYLYLQPNVPPCSGFRARCSGSCFSHRTHSLILTTKAIPELYKHLLYIPCDVWKHLEDIIELALIFFYSQTYFCLAVFKSKNWHSGVVNRLVLEVSVLMPFLNDTNHLYIFHVVCASTKKSDAHPFL